jgi:hypothetical protein
MQRDDFTFIRIYFLSDYYVDEVRWERLHKDCYKSHAYIMSPSRFAEAITFLLYYLEAPASSFRRGSAYSALVSSFVESRGLGDCNNTRLFPMENKRKRASGSSLDTMTNIHVPNRPIQLKAPCLRHRKSIFKHSEIGWRNSKWFKTTACYNNINIINQNRVLTLSNPNFLPPAYSPALIYFERERGWWITCNYPTVLKEKSINRKSTTCAICWLIIMSDFVRHYAFPIPDVFPHVEGL